MRALLAPLPLVVILALAVPAGADHCVTWSTSSPELDPSLVVCALSGFEEGCTSPFYLDNDLCQPQCLFSVAIYCEANGIPGLQRHDEWIDDTCHGMIPGDYFCT